MSKMGQHVQQLQQEAMDDLDDLSRFCENYRVWSEKLSQEAIEQQDAEMNRGEDDG